MLKKDPSLKNALAYKSSDVGSNKPPEFKIGLVDWCFAAFLLWYFPLTNLLARYLGF